MTATVILLALALLLGQAQPEKAVTPAEKRELLEVLAKLPTKGEFFADEGVTKAVPYTRVLLELTEKDLENRDLYGLLALSRGLVDRDEPRRYGLTHFDSIAHPTIKLAWAIMLLGDDVGPPKIVTFLRNALNSKEQAQTLAAMTGPGFEEFKERVLRAHERARQTKVELVKRITIDAIPRHGDAFDYNDESCVFAPDQLLHVCRPHDQHGELITYNLADGSTSRRPIPQPAGFKAEYDFKDYFEHPGLWINPRGDLFCRWTLRGNGDHALALLKKGAGAFQVTRVNLVLDHCYVVPESEGAWYLVEGWPRSAIYRVDGDLKLTHVGDFAGVGHHTIRILDARFISKDVVHFFWGDVLPTGNHLRMRCVDFDVQKRKWLHNREIFRLDRFVSSAADPTVLQLPDESLHYLWKVDEGEHQGEATGLYYQAEADGKTEKLSSAQEYRAIAVGNLIVVCYTMAESPEKVFFRVVNHGALGPVSEIIAAKGREHNLRTEYMALAGDSEQVRFITTLAPIALYTLKLQDAKKP
jgi:hypothetical protein